MGFDFWIGKNGSCANINETHMEHHEYHCNQRWNEGHPNGRQMFTYVTMQKRRGTGRDMTILQSRCWSWEATAKKSLDEFGPSMIRMAISDGNYCSQLPWFLNSPIPGEKKNPNKTWDMDMHVLSLPSIFRGKARDTRDVGAQVDTSESRKSRSSDDNDCRFPSWTQGMWTDLNVDSNVLSYARVTEMQNNGNVNEAEEDEYKVTHVRKRSVDALSECASILEINKMIELLKTVVEFPLNSTEESKPFDFDGKPSLPLDRTNIDTPSKCILTSEVTEMTKLIKTWIVSNVDSHTNRSPIDKNKTPSLPDKIENTSDLDLDYGFQPVVWGDITPLLSIFKNASTNNSSKISKPFITVDKYLVNDKRKLIPRRKRDTSDGNSNTLHNKWPVRRNFSPIGIKQNVPIPNLPLQALREANRLRTTTRERPTTQKPPKKIPTTQTPTTQKPILIAERPNKNPPSGKPYYLKNDYAMDTAERYNRLMNPWETRDRKEFDRDDDYVAPNKSRVQRYVDYIALWGYVTKPLKTAEQNPNGRNRRDIENKSKLNEHILKNYQWRCVMRVEDITTDTEKYVVFGGETTEGRVEDDQTSNPGIGLSDEKISDVTEMSNSTYGCLMLKNRGQNVLEYYITATETKKMAIDLCKEPETTKNISWVTVARKLESERKPIQCPVIPGMVFTGLIPTPPEYASETPRLCATLISKADECTKNDPDLLARMRFTISECTPVAGSPPNPEPNEDNEYQCLGMWSEVHIDPVSKKPALYTYLYTKRISPRLEGVEEFDCFVGTTSPDEADRNVTAMMMTTAGSGTTCGRDADPINDGMKLVGKMAGNITRECPPGACATSARPATTGGTWYPLKPQQVPQPPVATSNAATGGKWYAAGAPVPVATLNRSPPQPPILTGRQTGGNGQRQNGNRQTSRSSKLAMSPILIMVAIILRAVGIY